MTLRCKDADGNTRGDPKSGSSDPASHGISLTLRDAVIFLGGLAAGVGAGILTYFAVHNAPAAVLVGTRAYTGATSLLNALID
jgi:hypothetical protein